MLAILVSARAEAEGLALAKDIAARVRVMGGDGRESAAQGGNRLYVIGPAPASVGKINDVYRFMLYVKHGDYGRLVEVKNRVETFLEKREERAEKEKDNETVQFDFDPMSAY